MDRSVAIEDVTNLDKLFEAFERAWTKIYSQHLKNLVESIPRRLQSVFEVKGIPNIESDKKQCCYC